MEEKGMENPFAAVVTYFLQYSAAVLLAYEVHEQILQFGTQRWACGAPGVDPHRIWSFLNC
jgi:hypothetical protein